MLSDLRLRVRALFRARSAERDLADELRFHLEREIDKHVAAGMTRDNAMRRARLDFGGMAQIAEACRDARGISLVESVGQDARYAVRMMRRAPGYAAIAAATIALATAAIATVGSLADTLLWRRLAVDDAATIVSVAATRGRPGGDGAVSYPDYASFRDRATTVSALAAHYSTAPLFVTAGGTAGEVNGAVVSANYFTVLGLRPAAGRFFHPDEDRVPDRDRVVVIGYDFWRSRFAGGPSAINSIITINGVPFTVIGIAPPRPAALTPLPVQLYMPTMMLRVGYRWCADALSVDCTTLLMIGRLAAGHTATDVFAEFESLKPPSWLDAPAGQNSGFVVRHPRGMSEDDQESRLLAMLAVAAVVLLIVCSANVGGLLSAQTATRSREFAIRLAIGAGPFRIVRQVMTESLLIALAGGGGGIVLSRVFIAVLSRAFFSMDDEGHPLFYDFSQSSTLVVATVVAAIAAGLLFGVLPAVTAVRARSPRLGRSLVRWSNERALLVAQAAVAVAMLVTAALLAFGAHQVLQGRNYDTSHVALMRVRPRLVKYTPDRAQRFQRSVIQRLLAVPSVESVSMVGIGSVLGGGSTEVALPEWPQGQRLPVRFNEVGPAYFATLRTPLIAGREFDDHDTLDSVRVAIVNETFATRVLPAGQGLGSTVIVENVPRQVVGIVSDVSVKSRAERAEPWVYTPFWQNAGEVDSRIAVRTAGNPAMLLPELVREVHRIDPDVPIAEPITLAMRMTGLMRSTRVGALLIGYSAALATLLTALGLYGALAFAVSRRTKEIGIRFALGATRGRLVESIVADGLTVALAGAACGIVLAFGASRILSHLLYGSPSADWMFYAAAVTVVAALGAGASLVPARRAAAVEPIVALRQE